MTRRSFSIAALTLAAAVLFAACGGSSATTAPTGAAGSTPAGATPAGATAATATSAATPAAIATLEPGTTPNDNQDPVLAAEFPTTIDGQPVTDIETLNFAAEMQALGTTSSAMATIAAAFNSFGVDFSSLNSGTANATVDGEDVLIQAERVPNGDANKFLQNYPVIIAALDTAFLQSPPPAPAMAPASIGGKNVTVSTDSDGTKTTLYVKGDTIFILQDATDSQVSKILQALP